jgi:hypothetical protein
MQQTNIFKKIGLWLLPTWTEMFVYIFLAVVVFAIANISSVEQVLEVNNSTLSLQNVILSPLDWVFHHVGGDTFARVFPQVLFWGLIGILVYGLVLLLKNFTNEVSDDVDESNFVKPAGIGRWAEMRETLEKFLIRFSVVIIGLIYVFVFFHSILTRCTNQFRTTFSSKTPGELGYGLLTILLLALALHVFTVLVRLLTLRPPKNL